jgi:hypothetical protein
MYKVRRKLCTVSGNTAVFFRLCTVKLYTGGAGLVAVRTRLEGTPDSLYCVGRSIIRWQLVPVPDGLGEERITKGLTARSFLIKAIFASSPAVVRLNILVAVYIN